MRVIPDIGTCEVSRHQQVRWKARELQPLWAAMYPNLFDADDLRLALSQGKHGNHFVEWLGAILLHHLTGHLCLSQKYRNLNHARKREVLLRLGGTELVHVLSARRWPEFGRTQGPDLLMYEPDYSSFFFCEVKGPGDKLRTIQRRYFERLEEETGREIHLLSFVWPRHQRSSKTGAITDGSESPQI